MEGRCTCGAVWYKLTENPMFVLACHCTWCQRETGSAFALLALIEMTRITRLAGEVEFFDDEKYWSAESLARQKVMQGP